MQKMTRQDFSRCVDAFISQIAIAVTLIVVGGGVFSVSVFFLYVHCGRRRNAWVLFGGAGTCFTLAVFIATLELGHVQRLVDDLRNWLNLRPKFLLNSVQREAVIVGYEVYGNTKVPKP